MKLIKFRVFDNQETYIPTPYMVKAFLYGVTTMIRARILIALETSGSSGEVWRLRWDDFNAQNKSLTFIGVKGHKTLTYSISNELFGLLLQIPHKSDRIFRQYTILNI